MQKIRDRQISRQLQVYYAQLDEMAELTVIVKQLRAEGVAIGHTLGLSAFGEMDPDQTDRHRARQPRVFRLPAHQPRMGGRLPEHGQ